MGKPEGCREKRPLEALRAAPDYHEVFLGLSSTLGTAREKFGAGTLAAQTAAYALEDKVFAKAAWNLAPEPLRTSLRTSLRTAPNGSGAMRWHVRTH